MYKNQKITIENRVGKIKVTMEGIALKNGIKGDRVLVRNISSNYICSIRLSSTILLLEPTEVCIFDVDQCISWLQIFK